MLVHMHIKWTTDGVRSAPPAIIVVLLALLLWSGEYLRRDLMAPDEARYALVSQEMREGHWLVPFRQGEYYAHKPPLMFWLTNAFSAFTGFEIGKLAPRLPSLLGACLALWAATQLAARWFGLRAAWWVLVILPSSFLFWNKGGFGQIDMLLCGLEMMALYFLFTASGARSLILAYAFMGLGILAKGPVGFIVPLGAYITAILASRTSFPRPHWHWAWGTAIALLFPATWFALILWQGAPDGFWEELLMKQNIGRAAGEFGGHARPWHYFIPYYLLDFLPWTFLLPAAWVGLAATPESRQQRRLLLGWILFVVIFFSLSGSKRNLYILLVYPANALLIAGSLTHWGSLSPRLRSISALLPIGLLGLLGLVMLIAPASGQLPFPAWPLIPSGIALLCGSGFAWSQLRRDSGDLAWLRSLTLLMLGVFAWTGAFIIPNANDLKTPRELIEPTSRLLTEGDRLIVYRMHGEIYSLYTGFKGKMIFTDADLKDFITTSKQRNHVLVAKASDISALKSVFLDPMDTHRFQSGSKDLIWVEITQRPQFDQLPETPE